MYGLLSASFFALMLLCFNRLAFLFVACLKCFGVDVFKMLLLFCGWSSVCFVFGDVVFVVAMLLCVQYSCFAMLLYGLSSAVVCLMLFEFSRY